MGSIITFYSYKGGVGRTMAVANIAVVLARRGLRVLMVDWDVEAPGLHRYFAGSKLNDNGLLELLLDAARMPEGLPDWRPYVSAVELDANTKLTLMAAGRFDGDYEKRVLEFDWTDFFRRKRGGSILESLREQWLAAFDVTLIDSRTGITDSGGICTVQMPDVLVPVFAANWQSLEGTTKVVLRAQQARQTLAYDRTRLLVFPLVSRFDSRTEYRESQAWLRLFAENLKGFYSDWLPKDVDPFQMIERTKLPYVAFFSFGEKLPAVAEGTTDPESLGFAYRTAATLIAGDFKNVEQILFSRATPAKRTEARPLPPTPPAYPLPINFRPGFSLAKQATTLGPLADLAGTWVGSGFNLISLPDFDSTPPSTGPKPFRLKLNATREILQFIPIGGAIPNRGSETDLASGTGQTDINLYGLTYLQRVSDLVTNSSLHVEPGIWINVPATTVLPAQPATVVRMATIPNGDSLLAQSTFFTPAPVPGGPKIADIDSTPTGPGVTPGYLTPFVNPPLPPGILLPWVKNPNLALLAAIAGQTIVETVVIAISTTPVGGIVNIPFVVQNANATRLDAIFWIEKVQQSDGSTFLQLQYTQTVILNFLGIDWPHISVATLVKQ